VSYTLSGTQLNGVTNGSSYGDEAYSATNYPLVRLTNPSTGQVYYARTSNHSSMGVQTGAAIVSTHFVLGASVPAGDYDLQVVASGIPSDAVSVTVMETLSVSSFRIVRGLVRGGGLPEVQQSDDSYLRVANQPTVSFAEPGVQVEFSMVATTASPNEIKLSVETAVNAPMLTRTTYLFNYSANRYDLLEMAASSQSDTTTVITVSSGASDYVQPGTRTIKAKVAYRNQVVPRVGFWESRFDRVFVVLN
jgi:hypothetical protein